MDLFFLKKKKLPKNVYNHLQLTNKKLIYNIFKSK